MQVEATEETVRDGHRDERRTHTLRVSRNFYMVQSLQERLQLWWKWHGSDRMGGRRLRGLRRRKSVSGTKGNHPRVNAHTSAIDGFKRLGAFCHNSLVADR